jgi:crotonobetainyl-CoA:carnitine CoA-transferase CaiB-like acyl-CoA transferase
MSLAAKDGATTALDGIAVADLSDSIAGQYCSRLLADYGARVTLVEPPEGSPIRRAPPISIKSSESLLFRHLNAGKQSIALPADATERQRRISDIVATVDVVVLPRTAERCSLPTIPQRVIAAQIDDFSPQSPFASWQGPEMIVQALSGMMHNNGAYGREPIYGCGERSAYAAGLAAYVGVLTALYARPKLGRGQVVAIDRAETAAAMAFPYVMQYLYSGHDRSRAELNIPAGQVRCRGDWVCIWIYNFRWRALCRALGLERLIDDPRFCEPAIRRTNWDEMFAIFQEHLADRAADELVEVLQAAQIIAAKAPGPSELHGDRHLAARGFWETSGGERILGAPFRMSATPRRTPAPAPRLNDAANVGRAAQ